MLYAVTANQYKAVAGIDRKRFGDGEASRL